MIKVYINESQLEKIHEEVTFYDFITQMKTFLKGLLKNPVNTEIPSCLKDINKEDLINKMKNIGLIKSSEKIIEVPVTEGKHPFGKKMVAKHYIKYQIPKARFNEKIKTLYNDLIKRKSLNEEGEGASTCGSVMQGGGSNPSAGQFEMPLFKPIRRKIWHVNKK